MKKLTRNNRSAFTLVEIIISISILVIMTGYIFNVVWWLVEQWNKWKIYIDLWSEISALLSVISNYIYHADDLEILDSKEMVNWKTPFNGLLIKNSSDKLNSSLYTLVKPFAKDLVDRQLPVYPWDENYFVWITDINLFADIEYYKNGSNPIIIYSDPWNSSINYIFEHSWEEWVLLWWTDKDNFLNTPTWLYLSDSYLMISDTYNHAIHGVKLSDLIFSEGSLTNNNKKVIKGYIWKMWKWWFLDWKSWRNALNRPMWLTMVWNILYIVDSWNHAIRTFDFNAVAGELKTYIWSWEPWISEDHTFHSGFKLNSPTDIDYSKENWLLYVSDTNNNRVISFWPIWWESSTLTKKNKKPYTVAWIWKRAPALSWPWMFSPDLNIAYTDDSNSWYIIADEDLIWKSWFSWDFSISTSAQFNHPTGIEVFSKDTLLISDSWNNLIRRMVSVSKLQWLDGQLSENANVIETIAWNATEIILKSWRKEVPDIKSSLRAPRWANIDWEAKLSRINNPLWIRVVWDDFYFLSIKTWDDLKAYWDLRKYSSSGGITLKAEVSTIYTGAYKYINIDNISFSKVWDFLSSNSIIKLKFDLKSNKTFSDDINENKSQSLVKIAMSVVWYMRSDEPIISDITTSVSPRKIISVHP